MLLLFVAARLIFSESPSLSEEDLRFLDRVERKAFDYFVKERDPATGLVKDKANNFGADAGHIASIAATGFGLTAWGVGAQRGWISKEEAKNYCLQTLRFALKDLETNHGFFYHFMNGQTGKRTKNTELSSIDTALFLAGALTAGEYFKGTEVEELAHRIYERVDFAWMMNGGKTLSMGWDPVTGKFLNLRWNDYNESFILYLLAVASPTHPIPPESWHWVKKRIGVYEPYVFIFSPPLFTHQYSQIWVDLRDKNDGFADYFENSRVATLVNRQFCLDQRAKFKTYSENVWGLTASLGPGGYRAYGSGPGQAPHDGTVAPTAAGSSIVFTPELSLGALKFMYENFKDKLWGKYGFSDAFNLDRKWFAREVLGIDQGPLLLMIENYRSGLIWKTFGEHPAVKTGLERIGFKSGTLALRVPERPRIIVHSMKNKIEIDGRLDDWDLTQPLRLKSPEHWELGEISGLSDLQGDFYLAWDGDFFYVAARISDDSLVTKRKAAQMWKDDLVELFIDPERNGFVWGNPKDLQLGLGPGIDGIRARSWVWPGNTDPVQQGGVDVKIQKNEHGYDLEARISWKLLGIQPRPGRIFGFSPALHDLDEDGSEGKLTWFFLPEGKSGRNLIGEISLSD